jgi:hypothetical protein
MATSVEVKSWPILFSAPMVRAILEGRKTMTRRVVKVCYDHLDAGLTAPEWIQPGQAAFVSMSDPVGGGCDIVTCPYGVSGERLWVRETFGEANGHDRSGGGRCIVYRADNAAKYIMADDGGEGEKKWLGEPPRHADGPVRWSPSIFMPCWASRITLEVTGVRVERLQDITEEDCEAEGVGGYDDFANIWDCINKSRGYAWSLNPWCWCITFRRI